MAGKVKQPKNRGVCRVPVVMQLEALECGAASLAMILAYYGKWIPLEQIRSDCGVSRDGSNARNILNAARFYGLQASGYRYEPEALRDSGEFPCIVHWNFNHFVVLCGFRGGRAYLNDPAKGAYSVSMEAFDNAFTGICLCFSPSDRFEPSGKPKSMFSFAAKRLRGTGTAITFSVLTGVVAALIGLINPGFSRVFLDRLLTGTNPGWVLPFFLLLGGVSLVQIVISAVGEIYNLRIAGKMAAVGNASYMWKVLRMPLSFFTQRMTGDIQERKESNAVISGTLINTFAPLLLNVFMLLFYFFVMLKYSWILTLVGLSSLVINSFFSAYVSRRRVNITRVAMRDSAKLSSSTAVGIEMIETIKASGAENAYFAKWAGYQASVNAQQVKFIKLNHYLGIVSAFVTVTAGNAVLILGVYLTMTGKFTPGMILQFQGFLQAFMAPAQTFINAGQTLQEMRTQMERVDDVMEYPADDVFAPEAVPTEKDKPSRKLTGEIELKGIEFGYSRLAAPLITDFDLSIRQGDSVAIVGSSGCGKSTVSKLISGLYQPWKGEILFDGEPLSAIQKSIFSASVAVVDQDITLFEDTIENNIKMWDDSIEDFEMILAARDAQLHEDIMQRHGGYRYRITEDGQDFSGGQRQRMEIARVLAQDPTIVILDEATSALDAKTEYDVVKAIRARGITTIVIAHRLSTIRSCDEIIVMENGKIAARGTHEELMKTSKLYQTLVISE